MPVIEVHLLEGYSREDHQRLGEALTDACRLVVPAPADAVTVMFHEMQPAHYYRGRITRKPAQALPDPKALVHEFLKSLGNRDIETARSFLSDGFAMQFPGAPMMYDLEELIDWSLLRYRRIEKTFGKTDVFADADGVTVVYFYGTLSGEWPDGSEFQDVRFIDRFEIAGGKIKRQDVWNDLAEVRSSAAVSPQ